MAEKTNSLKKMFSSTAEKTSYFAGSQTRHLVPPGKEDATDSLLWLV